MNFFLRNRFEKSARLEKRANGGESYRQQNNHPSPAIVSGFSSQELARDIADELGSRIIHVSRKQHNDKEIQTSIEDHIRGQSVVVIASASGDPNKGEKETRLLLRATNRSSPKQTTLVIPYMWYGRSDDTWSERNSPGLTDTIETLRDHCQHVVIADPHNALLTREKFLDKASPIKTCVIADFAFPYAVQLKDLLATSIVTKENLLLAHADTGSTKRISRNFRACMYNILGYPDRNSDEDDWPQGIKDRDKRTNKSKVLDFTSDVKGKDVAVFEDMISSGGTACDLAEFLKNAGARSVLLFATTGLFTTDPKKEGLTAAVDRITQSKLDAVFITDTYNHQSTDPEIFVAIERSPIIHVIKSASFLASIVRAIHIEVSDHRHDLTPNNSISSILTGTHIDQRGKNQRMARPVELKAQSPLRRFAPS